MKVDVKTLESTPMTAQAATVPIGTALRIAPGFVATTSDETTGIETTIEARYNADAGRYLVTAVINRALRPDVDVNSIAIRQVSIAGILQAAIPTCIAVTLDDDTDWTTAGQLASTEGRIIPKWLAEQVVARGNHDARMEVIQILYGTAALAGMPPVKAVQTELDVPHRTASDWIRRAREAGRLEGITYTVGRQADG